MMNTEEYKKLIQDLCIEREQASRIKELELELELLKARNQQSTSTAPSLLFNRFIKLGKNGEELDSEARHWAGIKDLDNGLIWGKNWYPLDEFPVRPTTWYSSYDEYCQQNFDKTWNNGNNTENMINVIN